MKKIAYAGASKRGLTMYAENVNKYYTEYAQNVGVYDTNIKRAQYWLEKQGVPVYADFAEMLEKSGADTVIVTTVDGFHHEYVIAALRAGCDVICEKPMTTDAQKAKEIIAAEKETGKKLTVTFNARYAPFMSKVKELLAAGVIGEMYSVHFEWLLDCNMDVLAHGVSYFRRWNRYLKKSGGLLVHKATHHFDLINWWLGAAPKTVSAFGKLRRYGINGPFRGKNCRNCEHINECEFYYDVTKNKFEMEFYVAAENEDNYYKDDCVFREDIDICDTMAVNVEYENGALLTYSLNAHTAYEGWRTAFNGEKGRLEAFMPQSGLLSKTDELQIKIYDMDNNIITHNIAVDHGDHAGGDKRLLDALFIGTENDPLGRQATSVSGLNSMIIGAAANISIAENRMVSIADLLS